MDFILHPSSFILLFFRTFNVVFRAGTTGS